MGEAKRKAEQAKKRGRGLVISPPGYAQGGHIEVAGQFDPARLRFWTLFFDQLAWPKFRGFEIGGSAEIQFLEESSILLRPPTMKQDIDGRVLFGQAHIAAFEELEKNEPGAWAMDQGEHSLQFASQRNHAKGRITLELLNAIPVPDKDVPLEDILNFKAKRNIELENLRKQIDALYHTVNNSCDQEDALQIARRELDDSCAELINATKKSKMRFILGTLKPSFNLSIGGFTGEKMGAFAGEYLGPFLDGLASDMPITSNLIGAAIGAGSGLVISLQPGGVDIGPRNSPYAYVTSYHEELFIV